MLTHGVCLPHDNCVPYRTNITKPLLDTFGGEVLNQPRTLLIWRLQIITSLKVHINGIRFPTSKEVKGEIEK